MSANTPPTVRRIDTTVLVRVRNRADRIEVEKQNYKRETEGKSENSLRLVHVPALSGAITGGSVSRLAAGQR